MSREPCWSTSTPAELMAAAQDGDKDAFGELWVRYHPMVLRYARSRVQRLEVAEDIAADTFVRALRAIDQFTWQDRDPGAWLNTIARNLIADYRKSARYRHEVAVADDELPMAQTADPDPLADPAAVIDRLDDRESYNRLSAHLRLAILNLPTDAQADVMRYRHLDGFSVRQTAEATGRAETAVKQLCHRAIPTVVRAVRDAVADEQYVGFAPRAVA